MEKIPYLVQRWNKNGVNFKCDVYDSNKFDSLSPIRQVYGLVLNEKDELAVVLNHNKYWLLPGGKVEEGETVEEALVREIKEETNCDVNAKTAIPFFYQEQLEQNEDQTWTSKGYELRFMVKLEKYNPFVKDPDNGDITKVKWIHYTKIHEYLGWWESCDMIESLLPNAIAELKAKTK